MRHAGRPLTRRSFLSQAAAATGVLAAGGAVAARAAQADARVAIARSPSVLGDDGVRAEVVGQLIDRAITWLTGDESADRAWASLFSADEVVGIKPNGLGGYECSTAPEILEHCVHRLQGAGVRPGNIIVWEETPRQLAACGAPPDDPPWGIRALLTHDHLGETFRHGSLEDRLFGPLQTEIDAILNLPILKCHPICGVTLSMKNHYGSIGNPQGQHFDSCHTPIVDLADLPEIRDRTRLVVCDGTRSLIQGQAFGEPQYFPNIIMAATDVVAHDRVGANIIAEERERRGIAPLRDEGLEPRYIAMAADRGLGVGSMDQIECGVIELP